MWILWGALGRPAYKCRSRVKNPESLSRARLGLSPRVPTRQFSSNNVSGELVDPVRTTLIATERDNAGRPHERTTRIEDEKTVNRSCIKLKVTKLHHSVEYRL